jgi:hypothetical protein
MLGKITLAAGLLAIGAAFTPASAAPALPQSKPSAGIDGLVQQVGHRHRRHVYFHIGRRHHHHHHHRHHFGRVVIYGGYRAGYCSSWRYECAARWGWHTRGYHHCLWRHGC